MTRTRPPIFSTLFNQLAQIVEQVIDFRVVQVSECDLAGRTVQTAGNLAVGLNQQRRDSSGGGCLGDLRQVVTAKVLGLRRRLANAGQLFAGQEVKNAMRA